MASKEQKEKSAPDFVVPLIKEAVLSTKGVASLQEAPPIHSGVILTNLFGNVELEVFVNVSYGANIPEVSWNIQEKVKEALEKKTSIDPDHINIHIEGVDLTNVGKDEQEI